MNLNTANPWFVVLAGWCAMYGPTYWDLSGTLWRTDEQFHGAIILVVVAWLIWDARLRVLASPPAPRTGPLKQWVSVIAERLLYAAGYPIARSGVMLYMYLMARQSWWHNGAMLAAILPIAFAANIVRVIILVLITYHLGDEAGQGFLHGSAGIVLILAALLFLFLIDGVLSRLTLRRATLAP